jgi:hypothetical protein
MRNCPSSGFLNEGQRTVGGGEGKTKQSVLLIADLRFNWKARKND